MVWALRGFRGGGAASAAAPMAGIGLLTALPTISLGSSILRPWAWLANFAKNPGTCNDLAGNRIGWAPKSHGGLTVPAYINAAPAHLLHAPPANAAESAGRAWGFYAVRHPRSATACHDTPHSRKILPRNPQKVPRNLRKARQNFRKVRHFPYPSPTKSPAHAAKCGMGSGAPGSLAPHRRFWIWAKHPKFHRKCIDSITFFLHSAYTLRFLSYLCSKYLQRDRAKKPIRPPRSVAAHHAR